MKRTLFPTHALFYKAILIFSLMSLFQMNSFAQGPKWTTLGNTSATGDCIGSVNFQPLVFKTDNIVRGAFTATGNFQLNNLIGSGNRLLQTDATGNIIPFNMGSASDVLYGNGIWAPLPIFPSSLWSSSGGNVYYNTGKVGIGTSSPLYPLDVIGDVRISNNLYVGGGIVITDKVNANAEVVTGKVRADSIVTDSTKGFYGTSKFNGDVKLQNKLSVDGTTQINGDLYASVLKLGTPSDNLSISTLSLPGGGKLMAIGTAPMPILSCTPAYTTGNVQFNRITITNSINTNVFDFRNDGTNSFIDFGGPSISTIDPLTTIKINSFCASNIEMCAGGGNIWMAPTPNGKVGVGTISPSQKLEIAHDDLTGGIALNRVSSGTTSKSEIKFNKNGTELYAIGNDLNGTGSQTFFIWDNVTNTSPLVINAQGKVGLGGTAPPISSSIYKLYVEGGIATRDVKVTASSFPDYVFETNYNLITTNELEKYIIENHHLPHIPSAKEIEKNEGYEIGDMQIKLVKTVEEQALYIIDLQKQMDALKKEIANMKKK